MGTGRIFGSIAIFASIVALATWSGCGGSSNDQGVSFRALGFFADGTGSAGDTGRCASLRDTTNIPNDTDGDGSLDGAFMGLQNSMLQGINVDHVNLSYHINGSNLAIPNDVFALSVRLGPANNAEPNPPTVFAQIMVVGPAIMKFINDNSSRLPDLPFTLVASASAVGTADNSDDFSTNRVSYSVVFSALSGGCANPTPTPGESLEGESGTGTGG
jgi:hypothetical protein